MTRNRVFTIFAASAVFMVAGWTPAHAAPAPKPVDEAYAELTKALLYHDDQTVREEAAQALGRIGGEEAYAALAEAGFLDWPMWRYDAARTGRTPLVLAEELHLQWVRELPAPKRAWHHQWDDRGKLDFDVSYTPVVMGSRIFVPSNATDSVTAYDIHTGEEEWRYYADGPVRLAPVAWQDKLYFISDDGHLYCLAQDTGELVWKFKGGVSDQRLLGNERIINFWAARGGPVIFDGTLYFSAGIWPMHGVFLYALDAETGEIEWVNDRSSSDYVALPHGGAYGYGSIAPQGYIAANDAYLVVAGGRTLPGTLDRATGEIIDLELRGRKGTGGYAIYIDGQGKEPNAMIADRVAAIEDELDAEVFYSLAAHGKLFVVTEAGTLYCFGPEAAEPVRHEFAPKELTPASSDWAETAQELLDELGESEGYALVLGAGSGDLLKELINRSKLHVVVVEQNSGKVRALRDDLAAAGLSGHRAAVIEASPAYFAVQPYLFSMVVSEDAQAAGVPFNAGAMGVTLELLRPYGGVAYLGASGGPLEFLTAAAEDAGVDKVSVENRGAFLFASRGGPLTGAGEWTHQHRDPSNTLMSGDERVRLPLGLLWFGGPNNHNILPRHSGGPRPHVVDGRIIHLGVENVGARCVYTGRQLWDKDFPGIGHPFTNMNLEEAWRHGAEVYMTNIPGATYIGSPIVSLKDAIYLRYEGDIHKLDPATGETVAVFEIPGKSVVELYGEDMELPDWGHIHVQGDFIVTTSEPHLFEDQVLGWTESYSGTSSKRLVVMDRHDGTVLWEREAAIGFRHNAITSTEGRLFVIDGLSENAVAHLARRGAVPEDASSLMALNPADGSEIWHTTEDVFGTFLLYSPDHDILVEGGSQDLRRTLEDEPRQLIARNASDGGVLWESGANFTLPGAVHGDMLIPGRPGTARSILTGQEWVRAQPITGETVAWNYTRTYGCNTISASRHLLFYRSGSAGFFDMEYDSGTGNFGGFRTGCTANLIAADGVLTALDYTRTCTCSYQHQTSLAMVHMPNDDNIELWTRHDASPPDPKKHGINFGAPGRRVDRDSGTIWYEADGRLGRHASAMRDTGGGISWVSSFAKEFDEDEAGPITIYDLLEANYTVRLHFAELDESVEPGQRVFDVFIDGEEILTGFDIAAEAGGALRGVIKEFSIASGMSMDIELRASEDSDRAPLLNGIELIANGVEVAEAR